MAGGRAMIPRSKSRVLVLFSLSLLIFSLLFFFSSLSTPTLRNPTTTSSTTVNAETSFVASLEHFLTHKSPSASDDTVRGAVTEDDVSKLDDAVFRSESDRMYADPYYPVGLPLKVYVYEMPRKFTYDLLWLFRNTYKETSNLTSNGSPVHRLIEQHSIDYWLWADLIAPQSERLLRSVVRVHRQEEADFFYIPFFTTISFFLMEKQQCKALYRVKL